MTLSHLSLVANFVYISGVIPLAQNPQSRKWQITLNNAEDKGFNHERIKEELQKLKPIIYWCKASEIGLEEKTPHTHIYLACSSPVRFSTLKNLFEAAHIERANGTSQDNRNYILKSGKWENTKKAETSVEGSFEEWGEMPVERQGFGSIETAIIELIQDGATNGEILLEFPHYLRGLRDIDYVRQTFKAEENRDKWRNLDVNYIFGATMTGKTRFVMDTFGYSNVYAVNNYKHPFDGYAGENVLLLDEYANNFRIQDINNYLDGYPLSLPARYSNKQACYEKVYIVSNLNLLEQYTWEQVNHPAVWAAFIRRIHKVMHFISDGTRLEYTIKEYMLKGKSISANGVIER